MKFEPLTIEGVYGIASKPYKDFRGELTRIWDENSILSKFNLSQSSIVSNPTMGTLRGIHFQAPPFSENKIVECLSGKVFDVVVDLRVDSPSYGSCLELLLGPLQTFLGVVVPAGCAHGYLTLEPDTTLIYFMDKEYSPENSMGLHWDDPKLSIKWPINPLLISAQDSSWPGFQE
jgi:dTDP-4-dehydrorhamnose 3,5-epimerase